MLKKIFHIRSGIVLIAALIILNATAIYSETIKIGIPADFY